MNYQNYNLILLANGNGKRFDKQVEKQFFLIKNKPVFFYSLKTFLQDPHLKNVVIVTKKTKIKEFKNLIESNNPHQIPINYVEGGISRQESSAFGLECFYKLNLLEMPVLIHDAARPIVSLNSIPLLLHALKTVDGVTEGVKLVSTIAKINQENEIKQIPNRDEYLNIITPQAFIGSTIYAAHKHTKMENAFDDTSLLLAQKMKVKIIPLNVIDLKITHKEDIIRFSLMLQNEE